MGCCFADYATNQMEKLQKQQQEAFRKNAPDPYITSTGQICVPYIAITGEWSPKYPQWIQDWGVSQQEWITIIQTLDNATKPLMQSMYDTQKTVVKNSIKASPFNMQQNQANMFNKIAEGQAQMMKIPQIVESTLYTLNQNIFEQKSLQAVSGGSGIIVFKKSSPPITIGAFNPTQMNMIGQPMMMPTGTGYVKQQGEQAHLLAYNPPQYTYQ
eukprot:440361_1